MAMVYCRGCAKALHETAPACVQCGAPQAVSRQFAPEYADGLPEGVRGWCWGGFLLSWVWAIGNKTYWGLLALVPYVNIVVIIWLGIQGREMAWKNGKWDSVDHFNRVQRKWTQWGLGLLLASLVIVIGVAGMGASLLLHKPASGDTASVSAPAPIVGAGAEPANVIAAD